MGSLFVLLGPTGVGKTDLSLHLAEMLDCSIISSDSRQIYRETKIGTAAPTSDELNRVKHFFIGTRSITENYSSGQYELDAIPIIEDELKRSGNAILSGGSMLYIDAICKGIDDIPTIEIDIRKNVQNLYEQQGIEGLRNTIRLLDPAYYAQADLKNAKRIMHAIEVCWQTGVPFTSLHTGKSKNRNFNIIKIGLNRPREELYQRINQRVIAMINDGLVSEATDLYKYRDLNALNTVGYKEIFNYLDGIWSLERAIEMIQQNSRRYAKKQLSWFRRDQSITWFHPDQTNEITQFVKSNL